MMYSAARIIKALCWLLLGNEAQRQRVRLEGARIAASFFGDFPIGEHHKLWRKDKDFLDNYSRLSPGNPYSQERKFVLREFVKFTKGVAGCMAECGCYEGASAWFMAAEAPEVPLHLFDSFQGLSSLQASDEVRASASLPSWKVGDLSTSIEIAQWNLQKFTQVVFHPGWIPDRFPEVADERFRLVHIDADLFQPTYDSLAFFYPRMNKGGVIVMDDYGFLTCPGAYSAAHEYMKDKPEYILHVPTGQGAIIVA